MSGFDIAMAPAASRGGADMICKYRDAENGMCSLRSDLSYPLLEYCVEGPCPDEVLICNNCPLDGHCEFVKCWKKEGMQNVLDKQDKG